jgi:hypothetical protein
MSTSPLTRRPVHGGLCLGADASHVKASNSALAHIIAGGKKAGNFDLWFACIWILVENGTIPYLSPILPQIRAHMQYRLANNTTFISLNGLPEFPTTRVPLATAVWYILASPAQHIADPNPRRDVLRAHMTHIEELKMIVGLTGFSYPATVDQHIARLQVLFSMLAWVKTDRDGFRARMRALQQRCVRLDASALHSDVRRRETRCDEWIPVDGRPSVEQTLQILDSLAPSYRALSIPELVGLAALVDPKYAAGDIALPLALTPPAAASATTIEWSYGVRALPRVIVAISEKTCRPYYTTPHEGKVWKAAATETYGVPVESMLSLDRFYAMFIDKYARYPSRADMLAYVYNRCVVHGSHTTLPAQIEQFIEETDTQYESVRSAVPPEEFMRRYMASRSTEARARLELGDA